jgi:translation initiation factor 1A
MVRKPKAEEIEIAKIRLPREGEVLGVVEAMVGGDKLKVRCADEAVRICRIPGRLRKRMWIYTGDLVLVRPWAVQAAERADIIFKYTRTQAGWLKRKGYVKSIDLD